MQISAGVRLRHATFAGLPYDDESIYVRNPQTDSCCGFNCWVLPESIMYYFFMCLPHGRSCPVGLLGLFCGSQFKNKRKEKNIGVPVLMNGIVVTEAL